MTPITTPLPVNPVLFLNSGSFTFSGAASIRNFNLRDGLILSTADSSDKTSKLSMGKYAVLTVPVLWLISIPYCDKWLKSAFSSQ